MRHEVMYHEGTSARLERWEVHSGGELIGTVKPSGSRSRREFVAWWESAELGGGQIGTFESVEIGVQAILLSQPEPMRFGIDDLIGMVDEAGQRGGLPSMVAQDVVVALNRLKKVQDSGS